MTLLPYLFQWATEPDSTWEPSDAAVALTAAGFDGATELTPQFLRAVCKELFWDSRHVLDGRSLSGSGSRSRSLSWSWSWSWYWSEFGSKS
jgi:hypothetical protein